MKFSLITATLGRTAELLRLLEHLDRQTHRDFELLVVDQNPEGFLDPVLAPYCNRFAIMHLRSEKGLSRARNVGLQHVTGDIVAFPDDDCWYPADLLAKVAATLDQYPGYDGLTCRCIDEDGHDAFNKFDEAGGEVTKYNLWSRSNSNTIFVGSRLAAAAREFDAALGKGTASDTAAEEMDFLLRGMATGLNVLYCPEIYVHHPRKVPRYDETGHREARCHATGQGFVLRRHGYCFAFVVYLWMRALAGALVSLVTINWPRFRRHMAILQGRVQGWIG